MSDKIREALAGMLAIVDDSTGVAGYHRNGNVAEWGEFEEVDAARSALAEQPAPVAVPDGWKLVPVEPTRSMLHRAYDDCLGSWISRQSTGHDCASGVWESMLAAAPAAPAPAAQEPVARLIDEDAAYQMGAKGAEPTDCERRLFEAWMRGHCWKVVGEWDGRSYTAPSERGGLIDPAAMMTRQLWAAWRDRAALADYTAPPAAEQPDTVNFSRTQLRRYADHLQTAGYNNAADDLRALLAGGAE